MINATPDQLRRAADIQERIQSLQEQVSQLLGGGIPTPAEATSAPSKREVSAVARARMRAAQIARWADIKGTAPSASAKPAKQPKRRLSAQGIANIRAGVLKRMAAKNRPVQKPTVDFIAALRSARSAAAKAKRGSR